jgi:hypothetical protein
LKEKRKRKSTHDKITIKNPIRSPKSLELPNLNRLFFPGKKMSHSTDEDYMDLLASEFSEEAERGNTIQNDFRKKCYIVNTSYVNSTKNQINKKLKCKLWIFVESNNLMHFSHGKRTFCSANYSMFFGNQPIKTVSWSQDDVESKYQTCLFCKNCFTESIIMKRSRAFRSENLGDHHDHDDGKCERETILQCNMVENEYKCQKATFGVDHKFCDRHEKEVSGTLSAYFPKCLADIVFTKAFE